MDRLTIEQRHKNMSHIRSKNTSIEKLLCAELRGRGHGYRKNYKELWNRGLRYRKNVNGITGHPDLAFKGIKVAVFCDSEFFHGKDWAELKARLKKGKNPGFWIAKIERNMDRDEKNNLELRHMGWKVLRFWGDEIKKNRALCVDEIENTIVERMREFLDETDY